MIEIWIDGRTLGKAGAGFSVVMRHVRREWSRSVNCGKISTNQAEFKALEYAFLTLASGIKLLSDIDSHFT